MIGIVQTDGDEFARTGQRHPEARPVADQRQGRRIEGRELGQGMRRELPRADIRDLSAEVAHRARCIQYARAFVTGLAVAQKFHVGCYLSCEWLG